MKIKFLVIGDASGRRVNAFVECLKKLNIYSYTIITWLEILQDSSIFHESLQENTIIKLEPPEKDMEIYRELLKLGQLHKGLTIREINEIDFSYYPIIAPRQWYEGFQNLLEQMERACEDSPHKNIVVMNHFKETLIMMDKSKTYDFLADKINKYEFYLPPKVDASASYKEFKEIHGDKNLKCFIKLRYGSGGTGVLAYKSNPRLGQEKLWTSLNFEKIKGEKIFYSNNKVNYFDDKDMVRECIDWVLQSGAHIEQWIPKATYKGLSFDTRAFVIHKKAEYLISRLSKNPITNLHLGNKRMDSGDMMSKENIAMISRASEDVMKLFNRSLYAGIDVVCSTGYKPYIIDVNPFGDLFHNLIGTDENLHYIEIKTAIEMIRGESNECKYE
jgi:hypothetical protein